MLLLRGCHTRAEAEKGSGFTKFGKTSQGLKPLELT